MPLSGGLLLPLLHQRRRAVAQQHQCVKNSRAAAVGEETAAVENTVAHSRIQQHTAAHNTIVVECCV